MKTTVAWYCICVGLLLAGWWANDLRRGAWNRGDRTHGELGLHLAGEFVTAGLLIAAGVAWRDGTCGPADTAACWACSTWRVPWRDRYMPPVDTQLGPSVPTGARSRRGR